MARPVALLIAALAPAWLAGQVTVSTFASVADTTIYQPSDPMASLADASAWPANGAGIHLFAGRTNAGNGGFARRGLLRFDLSTLPPDAVIVEVTLELYLSQTITFPVRETAVSLHRAGMGWGEGTSDSPGQEGGGASATMNGATWGHSSFGVTAWNPGGVFASSASATTLVGDRYAFYSWTGAGLASDVASWLADPAVNFGWFILGDETDIATAKRFDTRERFEFDPATGRSTDPLLTVRWTVIPEPGTAPLLLGALGLLALVRRRSPWRAQPWG